LEYIMACGAEGVRSVPSRQPWVIGPALSFAIVLPSDLSRMTLRASRQKSL